MRSAPIGTDLAALDPDLRTAYQEELARARSLVATRLAEALWREDIGDARRRFHGHLHGFDRIVLDPVDADPVSLVADAGLRAELSSAVTGLALAYARRREQDALRRAEATAAGLADMVDLTGELDADEQTCRLEQLATEGHNLHPCGRTRLGWGLADLLAHDLESESTEVGFVTVPAELAVGDDLGWLVGAPAVDPARRVLPVHAWQLGLLRRRYPTAFADGTLAQVGAALPARPTAALRTVLPTGGPYLKLSLDIQVTSTRRSISAASTRNGPILSAVLRRLLDDDPGGDRVLLMAEQAGVFSPLGSGRDLSTVVRAGLAGRLGAGEVPVPGSALPAIDPVTGRTVLAGLVDRYAEHRGVVADAAAAQGFLADYARLLIPPVLRLAAAHGIGLESHLQNCVPTFVDGVPHRIGLRDFAGMRVHLPQLDASGVALSLWPGSVIGTGDRTVMLSKVAYTVFQAHLGELVLRLSQSHGLVEPAAWQAIRDVVRQALPGHPDAEFYLARQVPHKALTRMRLAGAGDLYVPVSNPMAADNDDL